MFRVGIRAFQSATYPQPSACSFNRHSLHVISESYQTIEGSPRTRYQSACSAQFLRNSVSFTDEQPHVLNFGFAASGYTESAFFFFFIYGERVVNLRFKRARYKLFRRYRHLRLRFHSRDKAPKRRISCTRISLPSLWVSSTWSLCNCSFSQQTFVQGKRCLTCSYL